VKEKINMKTNMKLKLAATAAAVLATGLLSQNAKADAALLNTQYDATLENSSELNYHNATFVVRSYVSQVSDINSPENGQYEYMYDFGASGDINKNGPPVGLASLSVYFDTAGTGANGAGGFQTTGTTMPYPVGTAAAAQTVAADVNWTFVPASQEEIVYFFSPDAPGFGTITAQNGGLWGQVDNSADLQTDLSNGNLDPLSRVLVPVVPAVPDTATTLSLLGGAIVGLGALRRKIGC
jgi:hypothetical protein